VELTGEPGHRGGGLRHRGPRLGAIHNDHEHHDDKDENRDPDSGFSFGLPSTRRTCFPSNVSAGIANVLSRERDAQDAGTAEHGAS
jgi:hypothetical protein